MTQSTHLRLVLPPEDQPTIQVTPNRIEQSINQYLLSRLQRGYSPRTVEAYRWHLARMAVWMAEHDVVSPGGLTDWLLVEWGASLFDHWQASTVRQGVLAARGWLQWLYEKHLIDEPLAASLDVPQPKARIQRTLWADEINRLLAACDTETVKGARDAALVSLLVDSGLRAAEVCRLRIADVDIEHRTLTVVVKGGDERRGYFSKATADRLQRWLRVRPRRAGVSTLFVALGGTRRDAKTGRNGSAEGCPLTTHGLRRLLRKLGEKAGVPGVSPHSFRRAFVVLLTEAGANDGMIQEWGRWRSEGMVKLYRRAYHGDTLYRKYAPMEYLEHGDH